MMNSKETIKVKYNNIIYDSQVPIDSIVDVNTLKNSIKNAIDSTINVDEVRLITVNAILLNENIIARYQKDGEKNAETLQRIIKSNSPVTLCIANNDKNLHIQISNNKFIDVPYYQNLTNNEEKMDEVKQRGNPITVQQLKAFVCAQLDDKHVSPEDIDICYGDKRLEDWRQLSDYNILPTSQLTVLNHRPEKYKIIAKTIIKKTKNKLIEATSESDGFKLFQSKSKNNAQINTAWTIVDSIEESLTNLSIQSQKDLLETFECLVGTLNEIEKGSGMQILSASFQAVGIPIKGIINKKGFMNTIHQTNKGDSQTTSKQNDGGCLIM